MTMATVGCTASSQLRTGPWAWKNGRQYGSSHCCFAIAMPMAGMCEVPMPPTIRATSISRSAQHGAEVLDAAPGLLGADILHVQAEDPGELGEVVDVAAGGDQRQHVAAPDCLALRLVESVLPAIRILVTQELGAVMRLVERETHLVEWIAATRRVAIANGC